MSKQIDGLEGVPENVAKRFVDFSQKLKSVEDIISKIDQNMIGDLHSQMTPLEKAKYDWISIYAINSLFFGIYPSEKKFSRDFPTNRWFKIISIFKIKWSKLEGSCNNSRTGNSK